MGMNTRNARRIKKVNCMRLRKFRNKAKEMNKTKDKSKPKAKKHMTPCKELFGYCF